MFTCKVLVMTSAIFLAHNLILFLHPLTSLPHKVPAASLLYSSSHFASEGITQKKNRVLSLTTILWQIEKYNVLRNSHL